MARPRVDSADDTVKVTLRMPARLFERLEEAAGRRGVQTSVLAREFLTAGLNGPTKSEPGLFIPQALLGVQGEGGTLAAGKGSDTSPAVNPPPGLDTPANPSRPERPQAPDSDALPSPVAGESTQPQPPAHGSPPPPTAETRAAKSREHRHTPAKAGMAVPRCSCGAIRRQDGIWHLETRPEADTPDALVDDSEEW